MKEKQVFFFKSISVIKYIMILKSLSNIQYIQPPEKCMKKKYWKQGVSLWLDHVWPIDTRLENRNLIDFSTEVPWSSMKLAVVQWAKLQCEKIFITFHEHRASRKYIPVL
jgi:hypothetical protein